MCTAKQNAMCDIINLALVINVVRDKLTQKRFLLGNDMDPEEVTTELPQLSQIEEILIAQVLPMLTVFKLKGGRLSYRDCNAFHDFKVKRANI
ncbi:24635_t:CDS:2 [Gigaspora margarita]|uniref:24635_t:CDS:1 n=1 Tax=Gigaspora margarita TaxID=4874 RepID=A0ABN7VEG3_GIGMA|nr:24635_t:CDS:2 [Gigaspora margarita]